MVLKSELNASIRKITITGALSVPVLIYCCSAFNWSLEETKKC
jgi:hypothetical protein